jgi:hypothetical protein
MEPWVRAIRRWHHADALRCEARLNNALPPDRLKETVVLEQNSCQLFCSCNTVGDGSNFIEVLLALNFKFLDPPAGVRSTCALHAQQRQPPPL